MTHDMKTRESAVGTLRMLSESEFEKISGGRDAVTDAVVISLVNAISGWCDALSASRIRGICN